MTERRRHGRMAMSLPVRVRGWRADKSPWEEITQIEDVSVSGLGFQLRNAVDLGQVLHLSLPLPRRFRQYDVFDAAYLVYAVVRFVSGARIGIMFLGKAAPRGFHDNPAARLMPQADPQQARQFQRYAAMVNVRLKRLDAPPGEANEEITVTEDVSQGGLRVLTAMPMAKGETVSVEEIDGDFRSQAQVQAVSIGRDNLPRLGLKFLDDDATQRSVAWLRRVGICVDPARALLAEADGPAAAPSLRSLQLARILFEECRENEHAICMTGRAAPGERRFNLCTCACHEPPST